MLPPPESQYEQPPREPANVSAANPRPVAMSPMPSSVAAALADGSGDFESSGEQRRGIGVGVLEPMEMDHDDDGQKDDDDDDDDEDMELGTSSGQGHTADGNDEGSDSEISEQGIPLVLEPPHVADLQDHLMGLIRRIDELNARDAARGVERAARPPEGTTGPIRPTIRSRQPGVLNLWDPADDTPSPSTSPGREDSASPGREAGGSSTRDDEADAPAWGGADTSMLGMGYEYADPRVAPISPSTYLRPGSRFHGTQQSERQRYDVQVEIKHVDLRESFLCGYLRIQGWSSPSSPFHLAFRPSSVLQSSPLTPNPLPGLTEDHPTLTTYFEGEIIGTKYGFNTQHPSWGASDKTDLSHWAKFQAFRPFQKQMKKGGGSGSNVVIKDVANRENIFMRWKEHFLVPDHRVRTIHGASFEGFYYICFNQLRGEVSGIYFHSKSEK